MLAGALPACLLSLSRIHESPYPNPAPVPAPTAGGGGSSSKGGSEGPQLVSSLAALVAQLRHGTVRAYLTGSCVSWFLSDILLCTHCATLLPFHSLPCPLLSVFFWCVCVCVLVGVCVDGNLLYQVLFLDSLLSDKNTLDDDYYHFSISILAAIGW